MKTTLVPRTIVSFVLSLLLLAAPATSRADILYFTGGPATNTISKIDSSGVATVFANSGLYNPLALAFDSAGNLYAANADNTIEKFNSSGVGTLFANSGLNAPVGLAFDSAGNLYAGNFGNNTIEKFNSLGVGTVFANSGLNNPSGLAFDSAGNLYVPNRGNNTIEKFNSSGVGTVFVTLGPDFLPFGLAFDSTGNLYADARGYLIEKFDSSGMDLGVFATATGYGLAFQPVPEPSTCALLVCGVIALFSVKRRRA